LKGTPSQHRGEHSDGFAGRNVGENEKEKEGEEEAETIEVVDSQHRRWGWRKRESGKMIK